MDNILHTQLREKYNPEGSELRKLQMDLLQILIFFDQFCKENNIEYWLSSGTCLGAIRHEGFIPWDDDVDIEMTLDNFLKFKSLFKETELYVLQTYDNDLFYTQPFPKLRSKNTFVCEGEFDKNYKYHGAFLDIFIVEESTYLVSRLCHLLMGGTRRIAYSIKSKSLSSTILKILKPINKYIVKVLCFLSKPFNKTGILRYSPGTGLSKEIRMYNDVFPLSKTIFEGVNLPIPGNVDKYLEKIFGNYMEIPQSIRNHNIIKNKNK